MKTITFILLLLVSGLCLSADDCECDCCKPKASASAETHPLRGVVKEVNASDNTLVVKHEEIPGFMKAMTMVFTVSHEDALRLAKGDVITATLSQKGDDWVLSGIQKAGAPTK